MTIGVLLFYMCMVGMTPSVVRACIMQSFLLLAPLFKRDSDPITALGAALLAGLAVGVYDNLAETAHGWHVESKFVPSMDPAQRQQLLHGWKRAVDAVLYWARED